MAPLTAVTGNYGLTKTLKAGTSERFGLDFTFIEFDSIPKAMRRMVRTLEFDVCEMAFTTYLCARAADVPVTAIPVFVTRTFHHWAVFHNIKAGITGPRDLEGKQVAVNRGYTVTTGLWVRGILQHEYGVDLDRITWLPTDEEHVAQYRAPANVDYRYRGRSIENLLLKEGVPAAIGDVKSASPDIKPLIPDARAAGFAYYRKTGIFPINHAITVKNATLAARPGLAKALYQAFKAAKAEYMKDPDPAAREIAAVTGDRYPFGVAANRKALEAVTQFGVEQHMTPRKFAIEELFPPETLDLD